MYVWSVADRGFLEGRTGRAGKMGIAITFLTNDDDEVMYVSLSPSSAMAFSDECCRYDLKQGMCCLVVTCARLTNRRNLQEPRVKGACGTCQTRGSATSSIAGDEEEARGRGGSVVRMYYISRRDLNYKKRLTAA